MRFRVYVELVIPEYYKEKDITLIDKKWHDVISICFDPRGNIVDITIPYKDGRLTMFHQYVKMRLALDGKIIWEN